MKCEQADAVKTALNIFGDKWSLLLIREIRDSPRSFCELEDLLEGISPRTLSQRLDKLEKAGIISKDAYCQKPLRYKYLLSPQGLELDSILNSVAEWGSKYA